MEWLKLKGVSENLGAIVSKFSYKLTIYKENLKAIIYLTIQGIVCRSKSNQDFIRKLNWTLETKKTEYGSFTIHMMKIKR
jgi:hypothetical protein